MSAPEDKLKERRGTWTGVRGCRERALLSCSGRMPVSSQRDAASEECALDVFPGPSFTFLLLRSLGCVGERCNVGAEYRTVTQHLEDPVWVCKDLFQSLSLPYQ